MYLCMGGWFFPVLFMVVARFVCMQWLVVALLYACASLLSLLGLVW